MYTANIKNLLDLFESELPSTWTSTNYKTSIPEYDVKTLEDGKFELTLNVLGHDPKNIKLEATEDKISIKSTKEEGSSSLIKDINTSFSLGKDYDGTKTEAKFQNGLLIITIDKRNERKAKSVKISY
jgi:HSP20 family molecular chaperone IbpA